MPLLVAFALVLATATAQVYNFSPIHATTLVYKASVSSDVDAACSTMAAGATGTGAQMYPMARFNLSSLTAGVVAGRSPVATLSFPVNGQSAQWPASTPITFGISRLRKTWKQGNIACTSPSVASAISAASGGASWYCQESATASCVTAWAAPGANDTASDIFPATTTVSHSKEVPAQPFSFDVSNDIVTMLASPQTDFGWIVRASQNVAFTGIQLGLPTLTVSLPTATNTRTRTVTRQTRTRTATKQTKTRTATKQTKTRTATKQTKTRTATKQTKTRTQTTTRTSTHQTKTPTRTMTKATKTRTRTKQTKTRTLTKRTYTRTATKQTRTRTATRQTRTRTATKHTRTRTATKQTRTATATATAGSTAGGGANTAAVAGGVIGGVAGLALVAGAVVWLRTRAGTHSKSGTAEPAIQLKQYEPTF
eukprot:TRINITY_DN3254_c0_g1_i3.p1 TRINITY_DN3254_c0_g1~~TRINITY_DN3254_c0_g1_i3.p1  ORF type:complete len:439 (+),score=96.06 TRINITY_DN3254_c0_g1_i3:43-1317(+)